ncbi:MAG: glucosidase [Planctomycetaceae bacterium]|nr:glucosidase [Planctomycetaceae bacterium]
MDQNGTTNPEQQRLDAEYQRAPGANWKRWGPYLADRQWGTVREDYSHDGKPWWSFPHDHARGRAYRWGEDGLLGITDRQCRMCFGLALWNGKDPILKERLFGVNGDEGNHGEDVKEEYYYLDSTPTHSYMKALYKYPQSAYPYDRLVHENQRRSRIEPELELCDLGIFDRKRYFDVQVEYAKESANNILIRITITNRGPALSTIHLLPTLWFRNTWTWGLREQETSQKPQLRLLPDGTVQASHETLGQFRFAAENYPTPELKKPAWMFTENDTHPKYLDDDSLSGKYVKDAFHEYLVGRHRDAVNPENVGTKCAAHYRLPIRSGEKACVHLRLFCEDESPKEVFGPGFDGVFDERIREADTFFEQKIPQSLPPTAQSIMRQAYAGLFWTKQFYHYSVYDWLKGDAKMPTMPASRRTIRNGDWPSLYNRDVISMPDKWEYPWYAAWDLAFHMIPFADTDNRFAQDQLILFLREWYMHPNGQIPAYEWNFSDVNPPVHAWACWRVYKKTGPPGKRDRLFLARTFQKLLLNFTWWVNRKDLLGKHIFSGGFLGLDNIGVFDRSKPLPTGGHLHQADGTAWMAFFCARMLRMALELASENPAYSDMASKFFEHYIEIADAMNTLGDTGLWDEQDGFYYDHLYNEGQHIPLRVRSMVGVIPLFTAIILSDHQLNKLPGFKKRMEWFVRNRQDQLQNITYMERSEEVGDDERGFLLLAIPTRQRMERLLHYILDENEFLSPYGVRSLSRIHEEHPFVFNSNGQEHRVAYVPGDSDSWMFGGNSNWRGPVWFPLNYLLIEALERYHEFYGDSFQVECPTGSGVMMNLDEVAQELMRRQVKLFVPDENGDRPCHGGDQRYREDPNWKDLILYYEYFHGETGRGLGASHQTGWTALVAKLIQKLHRRNALEGLDFPD